MRCACLMLACGTALAWTSVHAQSDDQPGAGARATVSPDVEQLIESIAAIPDVDAVEMSPDGQAVIYALRERDVSANQVRVDWKLTWISSGDSQPLRLDSTTRLVRWLPNSREFLAVVDKDGGTLVRRVQVGRSGTATTRDYPVPSAIFTMSVSNDGKQLAFAANRPASQTPEPSWPQDIETWQRAQSPFVELRLLDLSSGTLRTLGSSEVSLSGYGGLDWSPDDRTLAGTIDHLPNSQHRDTDIALFDVATGTMRQITNTPGLDADPTWSLDGRSIAFFSQFGIPEYYGGWPALISLADGHITAFDRATGLRASAMAIWRKDGRGFFYAAPSRMRSELVRLGVGGTAPQRCSPDRNDDRFIALRSFSRDRRRMAFVASTPLRPPELYVAELDPQGCAAGSSRPIWKQDQRASFEGRVSSRDVDWESGDHRFRIHGAVLAPRRGADAAVPLPGVLYLEGGPDMVTANFGGYVFDRVRLVLALQGYVVLTPNTRGRPGYGPEFLNGIRDSGRIRVPFQDAELGMDWLIEQGIVDPNRQAVIGYSYGALLAAFAISHTNRFRAAVVHEGASDMMRFAYPGQPGTYHFLAMRDLGGITDPFAPDQRRRIFEDSPGFHMNDATTPSLLLYGTRSLADQDGRRLWLALRRYRVATRMLVYDEGHGFAAPKSLVSAMGETLGWVSGYLANNQFGQVGQPR